MFYITADKHGNFFTYNFDLISFCNKLHTSKDDVLIILGDAGINYHINPSDTDRKYQNSSKMRNLKETLASLPITLFCIHGNHEARPETIVGYKEKEWNGGTVYFEEEYPSILFAKDGEVYNINGHKTLVLGGAYSVDKEYRIYMQQLGNMSAHWFDDEQMTEEKKEEIREKHFGKHYDLILSHTCPKKYEPVEVFLSGIDQSKVDKGMEEFLDECEENISYDKWYCGHYHTEKRIDKLEFLFNSVSCVED